ncbi:UPF0147 family protein [Candidatus Woesearchaeota archaeon]|nr:UPF0147 family protein [Candidatus Woesearchaeota archaeon]
MENNGTSLKDIIELLSQIEEDYTVPKNVRIKVKNVTTYLEENSQSIGVRVDKSLQELDEVADDPNVPSYIRTQIWNVVSLLESMSE